MRFVQAPSGYWLPEPTETPRKTKRATRSEKPAAQNADKSGKDGNAGNTCINGPPEAAMTGRKERTAANEPGGDAVESADNL